MSEESIKMNDLPEVGEELAEDELARVAGGLWRRGLPGSSATYVLNPGYCDADTDF
jgi:hypothetical protein